jgi:hypothetical protein
LQIELAVCDDDAAGALLIERACIASHSAGGVVRVRTSGVVVMVG